MKVNKIKKISGSKYKLYFDNDEKVNTYEEVILKQGLLYNKNIDSKKLNEICNDNIYYSIYNKVIAFIGKRIRSEKEIVDYISKYTSNIKDIKKIVEDIKKIGLINDRSFTKAFINDQIYLTNNGPYKIKKMLEEHEIDSNIIEDELGVIEEEVIKEKINKYISKKASLNHKYSNYVFKQKMLNELVNLGYDKDSIVDNLNDIHDNNIINKEFMKLYDKYKHKKSKQELYLYIKTKLYQKGFDVNDINEVLKKIGD